MANWDVIVVGLGGVGSAAAFHLASAGMRVLGLEMYHAGHDRGSSHGETRIIRQAYFEHPNYVPMLRQAYKLWHDLESQFGEQLFYQTGLVEVGPVDGIVLPGIIRCAELHGLDVETMPMHEASRRWPGLQGDHDSIVAYEKNAGYLRVEACVLAHLDRAQKQGAELRFNTNVYDWNQDEDGFTVTTQNGTENAPHLVLAAGPWSRKFLTQNKVELQVLRKHQYWYRPLQPGFDQRDNFPCYFYETSAGFFYGFPSRDDFGVKVARHSGGEKIDNPSDQAVGEDLEDRILVEEFLNDNLPGVLGDRVRHSPCYYTMSPDEHFIVDRLPNNEKAIIIAGLSGHGFKFTSVLGQIAMELITQRASSFDTAFLGLSRFNRQANLGH